MVGYVDPFPAMLFSNQRARRSCSKLLHVYPLICWMYLARLSRFMSLRVPRQSTQNRIEFDYDGIRMDATHLSSRMLKKSASSVLASFRPSTGTRPPHHSAARTDLVLLIRRTVRPRGYASALHSLRPCWTAFLSILREYLLLCHTFRASKFSSVKIVFPQPTKPDRHSCLSPVGSASRF